MSQIVLTDADAGSVRVIQHDDDVLVSLPETPSTGYRWSVDASHPDLASIAPGRRGAAPVGVGGTGTREFAIRGTKKGTVTLNARLWREWEGEASTKKVLSFTLDFR